MLDAAREIMLTEGPDGVSMRRIAEKIHYSATALYVHFADKTALLAELCHADFRMFAAQFGVAADEPDPIKRLRVAGRLFVEFGLQYPHHFRVMFMVPMSREQFAKIQEFNRGSEGNPSEDAYAFLRIIVEQALASGRCLPQHQDVEVVAQLLWATMHGVVSLRIAHGNSSWINWCDVHLLAESAMDSLLLWLTGDVNGSTDTQRAITTKKAAESQTGQSETIHSQRASSRTDKSKADRPNTGGPQTVESRKIKAQTAKKKQRT